VTPCQAPGHFPPPWFAQTEGLHQHTCQACETRTTVRIPPPPGDGFQKDPTCPGCGHDAHTGFCACGCLDDRNPKSASSVYRLAGLDRQEQSK
jgi:hypothetical protein